MTLVDETVANPEKTIWDVIFDKFTLLEKRCDLLESVFKKLMEFDMRLDTLEFNSNLPVKPGISEKLSTLEYKLENILEFLTETEGEVKNE